jgi:dTDP-4-dehydrorhamnose 3,5-epimerase
MKFNTTTLQDVYTIEMTPFGDNRGWFARSFCMKEFAEHNLETSYPQHNTGYSKTKGTVRGMHFQVPERYAWDAPPPTLPDENGLYACPVPGVTRAV